MNQENNPAEQHGPIYMAIERALWALGPALMLFLLLNVPAMQAARQQAEADFAAEAASENLAYCTKWGMPAGSPEHATCVLDLVAIRGRAELRVRDQVAAADF